jgi:hypothetical protein
MNTEQMNEQRVAEAVRRWMHEGPSRAPEYLLPSVSRALAPASGRGAGASARVGSRNLAVAVAGMAAAAVVVAGVGFLAQLLRPSGATPNPTHLDSPRPVASPEVVSAVVGGPTLTWTRIEDPPSLNGRTPVVIVHSGERFIAIADEALLTSIDGLEWTRESGGTVPLAFSTDEFAAWGDTLLHRGDGELTVMRGSGSPSVGTVDGRPVAAAIGPAGIVVGSNSQLDHLDILAEVLGPEWDRFEGSVAVEDGIMTATTEDGRSAQVVLSEHGYSEEDLRPRYSGWYSADGTSWQLIAGFPEGTIKSIVGTASGFYAVVGYEMWHSVDGREWSVIGRSVANALYRWRDGVLTDRMNYWTVEGHVQDISVAGIAELGESGSFANFPAVGTGPLGIAALTVDGRIMFSPDAVRWSVASLPDDLLQMNTGGDDHVIAMVAVSADKVVIDLLGVAESTYWVGVPAR